MIRKGMIAAIVLAMVTATAASAEPASELQQSLDQMARTGAQGVQVLITDDGRRVSARAGTAELGSSRPVPVSGRYRVGSISKVFTATVVLQLVAEGKVALDSPVSAYLPGLVPDGISVRMLLRHTSGLYNYTSALPLDPGDFESIRYQHHSPRSLVGLATSRPLDFPPGSQFAYSNTNYIVLGMLIEEVAGVSYERAVEQRILRPLRMWQTTVPGDRVDVPGPHAHGYYRVAGEAVDVTRLNPSVAWAAGAIISTNADLDRFLVALLGGKLLPGAQLAEMLGTTAVSGDYGLGIYKMDLPCGVTVWGHGGGIPGYSSLALSTRDARTRLEMSLTAAPDPGPVDGYDDVINQAFCK
ncbi:serine hydrolase domain-containing protein [Actinokineospora sp. HUAS TT18]|uniref:serine hydrolase domain-containing protein n=1 Tax=Actinokineospora sp. HUAS TT18 TaxID=3447451 RepID=UPI003F520C5C